MSIIWYNLAMCTSFTQKKKNRKCHAKHEFSSLQLNRKIGLGHRMHKYHHHHHHRNQCDSIRCQKCDLEIGYTKGGENEKSTAT